MAVDPLFFISNFSTGGFLLFISLDINILPRRFGETFYNPPRKFLEDFSSACTITYSSYNSSFNILIIQRITSRIISLITTSLKQ